MSQKNKLLFFNEKGYPYNFEYDEYSEQYSGKILFDENSNDTFKTKGMYIFEEVKPISITTELKLNKMELYNTCGLTFQHGTNIKYDIEKIEKVNSSPDFYSKWIFGENFEEIFKKGTLIVFSDLLFTSPTTDFGFDYYTVLENKPGAIMIISNTRNDLWNNPCLSGSVNTVNTVRYNDYDATLVPTIQNYTLHENKKLSISGSIINDSVNVFKKKSVATTYYQNWEMTGNTADIFKLELTLHTERPKYYTGNVNFLLAGTSAYLQFNDEHSMVTNLEIGTKFIFEDYDDEPILATNPIFTYENIATKVFLYDGEIEFVREENKSASNIAQFNNTDTSPNPNQNSNSNSNSQGNLFLGLTLANNFIQYDNYMKIKGDMLDWDMKLNIGDIIVLEESDVSLSSSTQKNLNRTTSIKNIIYFKEIRVKHYISAIKNYSTWYNHVRQKSINNNISIQKQIKWDANWMYENVDINVEHENYIPLEERYDLIYINNYLIKETNLNNYKIMKKLAPGTSNIIECSFSPYTTTDMSFDKDVVCYSTSNILEFEVPILSESESTTQTPDYEETINGFNSKYKSRLDKYGLFIYYNEGIVNLHSIYHTNSTQNNYIDTKLFINIDSGITNTSGITNSKIETAIIEFKHDVKDQVIYPYEYNRFDSKYYAEIMLDIQNNENNYGVNIELNDIDFYTAYDTSNQQTIDNFVDTYSLIFHNMGLSLTSGLTTDPVYVDNYKEMRITLWITTIIKSTYRNEDGRTWYDVIKKKALEHNRSLDEQLYLDATWMYNTYDDHSGAIEYESGQTMLVIEGLYSNVEVRSLKVKVNLYSEDEIMNVRQNNAFYITGNELEITNINTNNFFDYGFATGMVISVSGSSFSQNNKNYNIIGLTEHEIELSYQGVFIDDNTIITIDSQTFLRKPRESYNKDIYYSFRFDEPKNNANFTNDIFFYDLSGEQLKPAKDIISGEYIESTRYIGPKPLWDIENECDDKRVLLIDHPNDNLEEIENPLKQQTVFRGKDGSYCVEFLLDEYDSVSNYNFAAEPLQIFLGFNSPAEGVEDATIVLDLVDNTYFSGYTNSLIEITDMEFTFDETGLLKIITNGLFDFGQKGFEKDQLIEIDFIDDSVTGTTSFLNYGKMQIEYVNSKQIKIYADDDVSFVPFFTSGTTESYKFSIKVLPKPLLTFEILGETEIEDERFTINLKNLGVDLTEDIEHIFIDSDIKEDGIDYKLLNKKRKEMLLMYPEIYNYIGSYKALINSINFFGWNDLQLNEYYRNINEESDLYKKLVKVEINDIFDNTVDGWSETDLIKGAYDNGSYKKTNLFNLTYRITDEDGNNILMYSLEEIQIKLAKLKRWLTKYVIPLSANLVDITGTVATKGTVYHQFNVSNFVQKIGSSSEATGVNFNVSDTLNIAQNYLFQIDFYTLNEFVPSGWTCKVRTFSKDTTTGKLIPQQYFKLMKNDLNSFSFNIEQNIDKYIYIETQAYNDFGLGAVYNKLLNTSTSRNYILINNNFHINGSSKQYLPINGEYYWFDDDGSIWLED